MYHNDKKYALTNCVLLDGSEHMEPQTGKAVCIDGEKINEIVDAQHIFATMSSDEFKKWQPQSKNFSLWLPF